MGKEVNGKRISRLLSFTSTNVLGKTYGEVNAVMPSSCLGVDCGLDLVPADVGVGPALKLFDIWLGVCKDNPRAAVAPAPELDGTPPVMIMLLLLVEAKGLVVEAVDCPPN